MPAALIESPQQSQRSPSSTAAPITAIKSFPSESWIIPSLKSVNTSSPSTSPCSTSSSFHRLILSTTFSSYDGPLLNGLAHGFGSAIYKSGQTYEGEFSHGLMYGQGVYKWPSGTVYTGEMQAHSCTGTGTILWSDGSTYQGEVLDGYRHGEGTFIDPVLICLYEGTWKHGLRHGKGKLTYDELGQSWYDGDWYEGMRQGTGTIRYKSGNTYSGDWLCDRKCGVGKMTWLDRGQTYEGEWRNDKPHGKGEYVWMDMSTLNKTVGLQQQQQGGGKHSHHQPPPQQPQTHVKDIIHAVRATPIGNASDRGNTTYGGMRGSIKNDSSTNLASIPSSSATTGAAAQSSPKGSSSSLPASSSRRFSSFLTTAAPPATSNGTSTAPTIGSISHRTLITHLPHANRYIGSFLSGIREGHGTFHYADGSKYDGEWKENRKHDQGGVFTLVNGEEWKGVFDHDQTENQNTDLFRATNADYFTQ